MKKAFSLTLAALMLLGCMSLSAFAAENQKVLTLTAEVPSQELSYEMVIPESVETVTAAGIHKIGAPSVANVKNGSMATVISYTASGTSFKSEGKADIPATYYTDNLGKNELDPQTPIKVYECNGPVDSLTNLYVAIDAADWSAAEEGTYTAAVTFNFEESAAVTKTIRELRKDLLSVIPVGGGSSFDAPRDAWIDAATGTKCWWCDGSITICTVGTNVVDVFGDLIDGTNPLSSNIVFAHSDGNWIWRTYDEIPDCGPRSTCMQLVVKDGKLTEIILQLSISDTVFTFKPANN